MFRVNGCALVTCSKTAKYPISAWKSCRTVWGNGAHSVKLKMGSELKSKMIPVLNCHSFFTGLVLALCWDLHVVSIFPFPFSGVLFERTHWQKEMSYCSWYDLGFVKLLRIERKNNRLAIWYLTFSRAYLCTISHPSVPCHAIHLTSQTVAAKRQKLIGAKYERNSSHFSIQKNGENAGFASSTIYFWFLPLFPFWL